MARTHNSIAPQLAGQLAQVARDLRRAIYGPEGFPQWGTRFDEIEQQGMDLGLEVARLFMEQSLASQAQAGLPEEALQEQQRETPKIIKHCERKLETSAGEVHWDQPQTRLTKARRDFFPSGPGTGH